MLSARRWRLPALAVLVVLLALLVASRCDDADISGIQGTSEDPVLLVALDTCNADVSVDVEEREDRVILRATHHDWYRYLFGSDDCADGVLVELNAPLGTRTVTDSAGRELPVFEP